MSILLTGQNKAGVLFFSFALTQFHACRMIAQARNMVTRITTYVQNSLYLQITPHFQHFHYIAPSWLAERSLQKIIIFIYNQVKKSLCNTIKILF